MIHSMEICLEILLGKEASGEVVLNVDYQVTSGGSPAHMGSMNYPGHPAEPMEIEIENVLWPYIRRIKEGEARSGGDVPFGYIADHLDMPLGAIPDAVLEGIENHLAENHEEPEEDY